MTVPYAELKKELDRLVGEVVATGEPLEVELDGHRLKIVLADKPDKFDRLVPNHGVIGDPDDLVDLKVWEWDEEKNL